MAAEVQVSSEEEEQLLRNLGEKEMEYMRLQRHKIGIDYFELLRLIDMKSIGICAEPPKIPFIFYFQGFKFKNWYILLEGHSHQSGNFCSYKKPVAVNWFEGRENGGKDLHISVTMPAIEGRL